MNELMTNGKRMLADVAVGLLSGYAGTRVMEPISMKLYELEPEEDREQEDAVRPGPPYQVAAEKTARLMDVELTDEQLKRAGMAFHLGLGMSWGVVYTLLRRNTNLSPLANGLLTGAAMSAIVDEGVTPALGFSAPNRAYPVSTHLRGFVAHLAFGLGVAGTSEVVYALLRKIGLASE